MWRDYQIRYLFPDFDPHLSLCDVRQLFPDYKPNPIVDFECIGPPAEGFEDVSSAALS